MECMFVCNTAVTHGGDYDVRNVKNSNVPSCGLCIDPNRNNNPDTKAGLGPEKTNTETCTIYVNQSVGARSGPTNLLF